MAKAVVRARSAAPPAVVLQVLLVPLFWGSAFALSKLGVESAGPLLAAGARFGLAALIMGALLLIRRQSVPVRRLPKLALLGLLGVGIYNWCFFLGLGLAPSTDGALIIPILGPICTTLLAALFLGEKLTIGKISGLALALAGAIVFFWSVLTTLQGGPRVWGDLLFLTSTISFSLYTLLGKKVVAELGSLRTTAWALIFGGVMLTVTALPSLPAGGLGTLGWPFWANMIYLAALPSALAYTIFYRGVGLIGASRTAAFMNLVPIFAVALSSWLLHEVPGPQQAVGGVIMLLGVVQVNRG